MSIQNEVLLNLSATGPATIRELNAIIETETRFQVKDAVRSLIQEGLVAAFKNEDYPRGTIYAAV